MIGRPFLGKLPLWQGNQEFTFPGTLSYNWLEKNAGEEKQNSEV
jgi:hypothetical protein